uniref:Uncharacterized protein n=1 Tax=Triticum urartu TaxID=4572 RepID=A0A8R7R245_TRIUA
MMRLRGVRCGGPVTLSPKSPCCNSSYSQIIPGAFYAYGIKFKSLVNREATNNTPDVIQIPMENRDA